MDSDIRVNLVNRLVKREDITNCSYGCLARANDLLTVKYEYCLSMSASG